MSTAVDVEAPGRTIRLLAAALAGVGPGLDEHVALHGPPPVTGRDRDQRHAERLRQEILASGLTGRGGGGFPTARKLELLAGQRRRPVLVVNAMEGEPASSKDRVLVGHSPHLVLDGAQVAAAAVDAVEIACCVPVEDAASADALRRATAERVAAGLDAVPVRLEHPPGRYAAGEESALVDWVGGGRGLPAFRPDKGSPLRIGRTPVLLQNAETLAHLALIARHGAQWFRTAGTADAPGTTLVTVSGAVERPGVLEVELGTPLGAVLERAGVADVHAVLLGGYGGAWLSAERLDIPFAPRPLAAAGTMVGAGVVAVLPPGACGLSETARVVSYLAGQTAGQCGPCTFGMPALADDLARLAAGRSDGRLGDRLASRLEAVDGRGACRMPDGAARLVRSALAVFADDARAHARRHPCPGWNRRPILPVPATPGPRPSARSR
jgi:NADH:ubiquinone oxidoreductase subunit F (NADH-binding)